MNYSENVGTILRLPIKPTFSIPGFLSIEFSNGVDTADSTRLDVEVP